MRSGANDECNYLAVAISSQCYFLQQIEVQIVKKKHQMFFIVQAWPANYKNANMAPTPDA
jgi:hypothetical protein